MGDTAGAAAGGGGPGETGRPTRRRGAELERAILEAAWEQLIEEGYERFGFDAVAARAQTSKPVLYRRWRTRDELLHATVRHRGTHDRLPAPDTGTLRGDLLALLGDANVRRSEMFVALASMLASHHKETGETPAQMREELLGGRPTAVDTVIERGLERGEIDPARLTPRIAALPFDLFRHEVFMTLQAVPDHVLRQIVDDIFIPLVAPRGQVRGGAPPAG